MKPTIEVLGDHVLWCKLPPGFGLLSSGGSSAGHSAEQLYSQLQFRKYAYQELAPYAVGVIRDQNPPLSCKNDVYKQSGCGLGGRLDHTPFVKAVDDGSWINLDTHYELKFVTTENKKD
jgi:hypothetical protein